MAYESAATNLVAGDTNGVSDIFVIDLVYYNPPTPTPTVTPTFVPPTVPPTAPVPTNVPTATNTPWPTNTPTVTPTPTPLPGPDLLVESVSFYPASANYEPDINGIVSITVTARIRNNGNRVAPLTMYDPGVKVSFYIDREPTCADDGDIVYYFIRSDGWSYQLNPGAYWDVPAQVKLVDRDYGTHTVNVKVDPCNWITEQRENNNTNAGTYNIIRADYVIDEVSIAPLVPQVNQPMTYTIVARNAGTQRPPVGQSTALGFWVYDIGEGSDPALVGCPGQPVTTGGHGNSWAPITLDPGEVYTATYTYVFTETHPLMWARAFIDYNCTVDEINDYNNYSNYGSGPLTFSVEQWLPDLVVDSIEPVPARPPLNTPFSYRVTVRNAGQGASAWSTLSIYPGSGPDIHPNYCDVTTNRLAFGQLPALAAGATTVVTLTVPALTDANPHLVYALADWTCDRTEDNENNNYANVAVYAAAPDLAVDSITWQPNPLYPGQYLSYQVAVSNTGTLASGPTSLAVYSGTAPSLCPPTPGGSRGSVAVPALAVGEMTTVTVNSPAFNVAGNYMIHAYVDYACNTVEEDDANNIDSASVFVSPPVLPNLRVTSLSPVPAQPYARETFTYSVTVANVGDGPTGYSLLGLRLDTEPALCGNTVWLNTAWVPPLNGHTSTTVSVASPAFAEAGGHTVYAVIDFPCNITEDTETDNRYGPISVNVQPPRQPDWAVTGITAIPALPNARSWFSYTISLNNHGTQASPPVSVALYADRPPDACGDQGWLSIGQAPALLPGASTVITVNSRLQEAGAHQITAIADFTCLYDEANETDNRYGPVTLNVAPPVMPDLVVESLGTIPAQPRADETFTYTVRIRNTGTAASNTDYVGIWDDTPPDCGSQDWVNTAQVPPLAVGQAVTVTAISPPVGGEAHTMPAWAFVNFNCDFERELTLSNNMLGPVDIAIQAPQRPDLAIDALAVHPSTYYANQPISYTVTVSNTGAKASSTTGLRLYLDSMPDFCNDNDWFNAVLVPPIAAGGSADIVVTGQPIAVVGDHGVWGVIDATCTETEINETNNRYGPQGVAVWEPLKPDLAIEKITMSPAGPGQDEWTTFSLIIRNQSTVASPSTVVGLYRDRVPAECPTVDQGDLGAYVPPLAAGAAYTATLTTRFDSAGTHFVTAKVDYGCRIEEEQEWDNVHAYTLWVNPPLLPDLVVDSLEVEPNPPFAEEWATVRTTVRNQGAKRSGWTWGGVYHDRLPTGCPSTPADVGDEVFYIPPLEPGESATFTAPHRFGEEGIVEIWAYLDYPCTLAESNEDNNESYLYFLLRPPRLPDLIVENFSMEPASPLAGQLVTFNVVVRNRGVGPSRLWTWAGLYLDRDAAICPFIDSNIGDRVDRLAPLDPGQSTTLTFQATFTEGPHTFAFQPDYTCIITESDEGNNITYPAVAFEVGPPALPDLIVESVVLDPPSPMVNQTINFSMTVKNVGTASSGWNWSGIYFDRIPPGCPRSPSGDDGYIGDNVGHIPPLAPGASYTHGGMLRYFPAVGYYAVYGFADYGCSLAEGNKSNNLFTGFGFYVAERSGVDLVVTNLTAAPTIPGIDETVTFTASVRNLGLATSSSAQLGLFIDRIPANCPAGLSADETATIPSLVPGGGTQVILTRAFSAAGWHDVRAFADWICAMPESNELNNLSNAVALAVAPTTLPDLVVTSLAAQQAAPVAGQPITFTAVVRNFGFAGSGWARLGIYSGSAPVSGSGGCSQTPLGYVDVPALAIGGEAGVEVVGTVVAGGQYQFYALADDRCAVTEYREDNNRFGPLALSIAGPPMPDLSITLVNYTPLQPQAGQPVTYTVQIRNSGTGALNNPAASVGLYIDRSPVGCADTPDHLVALPVIAVGGTETVQIVDSTGFASGGDHQVYLVADRACIVGETDETNNRYGPMQLTASSPSLPDLQITSLTALPSNPALGDTVRYIVRVKNAGTEPMPEGSDVRLGLYLDSTPAACSDPQPSQWLPAPALAIGVSQDFLFEYSAFAEGTHNAYAVADTTCALGELNDGNNQAGPAVVVVGPLPPTPTPTPTPTPAPKTTHDYAFLATSGDATVAGLWVVDVDDPSSPQAAAFLALSGEPQGLALARLGADRYALIAAGAAGLHVVKVTDPTAPVLVSTLGTTGSAAGVAAYGSYAYVADSIGGLAVIDLTNPAAPVAVASYDTPGVAYDVAIWSPVAGEVYAAVADGAAGLTLLNVTTPASPLYVSQYDTPGEGLGVTVSASGAGIGAGTVLAYVADGSTGVAVIDVSIPAVPQFAALSNTPGTALSVAVDAGGSGSFAYVADNDQGLRIINPLTVSPTSQACDAAGNCTSAAVTGGTGAAQAAIQATSPGTAGGAAFVVSEAAARLARAPVAAATREAVVSGRASEGSGQWAGVSGQAAGGIHGFTLRRMLETVDAEDPVYVTISGLPLVLDSMAPVNVGGQAVAMTSTLKSLRVSADGEPILIQEWTAGAVADITWSVPWTPSADGQHILQAVAKDQTDVWASALYTVTVDTDLPELAVTSLVITSTKVYPVDRIDVTGFVTDTGGVSTVEWRVNGSGDDWLPALVDELAPGESGPIEWRGPWSLDTPLPDGVAGNGSFDIDARVTDLAGHITETTVPVQVDVVPPSGADLSLTSGGSPVAPGDTLTQAGAELDLTWTAGADGSGLIPYTVRWTTQATSTLASETLLSVPVAGPLTSSFTPGEGQRVIVQLGMEDTVGNRSWRTFGPVDVDSQVTPDYCVLPALDASTAMPAAWMNSGCTLLGVDRRVATTGLGEQQLYATWNAEALRLAWTGANWYTDGDLFIYLDTQSGGAGSAYNPYLIESAGGLVPDQTVITLPAAMAADTLVWVRDSGDAVLLKWNGSDWDWAAPLDASNFLSWTGAGTAAVTGRGQTDLYLPFNLLGITGNGSSNALKLLAIASEEGTLAAWAVLPASNGVNSAQALPGDSPAGLDLTLDHAYQWPALGAGVCPNGSDAISATSYAAEPKITLASRPAGSSLSLLSDSLYWLRDLLLGSPPADVGTYLSNLTPGQPQVGSGSPVTYTLTYRNVGSGPARGVEAAVDALYTLQLTGGQEQTISLGDVEPGEQASVVLHGTVNLSLSTEPWAALAVRIYDSAHPSSGQPADWLWTHQPVDRSAPLFFGIDRPSFLLRVGRKHADRLRL